MEVLSGAIADVMEKCLGQKVGAQERDVTYDQSAYEIFHLVAAEPHILIRVGELGEIERKLLLLERAAGEIGLLERTRWWLRGEAGSSVGMFISHGLHAGA